MSEDGDFSRDAAARRFLTARRPTGKLDRADRRALRELWSLLYRAVRRQSVAVDRALRSIASIARRTGKLSTELSVLRQRVDRLERRLDAQVGDRSRAGTSR